LSVTYTWFWGKFERKNHLEDPDVDGKIILRLIILKLRWKCIMRAWTGPIWLWTGIEGGNAKAIINFRVPNFVGKFLTR
jgi:hypothetical protein